MAKYKAYTEYKDSGVEWLGDIPRDWLFSKLRYQFTFGKGLTITKENLQDEGIPCVNYGEVHSKYGFELDPKIHSLKCVDDKYLKHNSSSLLVKGDIIFADTSEDIDGSGNFTQLVSDEIVFAGYHTIIARPFERGNSRFYAYLLDCKELRTQIRHAVKGVKVFSITQAILRNILIWLPSENEQKNIAAFLDHETVKIDNLIEKQQQLIELLKEKRQALISHAVTKGLNPDVPMKDSGVEWLGEVPEHWEITKLKWVGKTTSGGTPTTSKFEIYYENGHIPWIRTTDLNNSEIFDTPIKITTRAINDTACSILPKGSVLLGMYGGAGSIGKHALLCFESTINQAVCGVLPCEKILPDFLHKYYEYYRPFWMIDAAGTRKDPNIGQDTIKEGMIVIPPYEEQIAINTYISEMYNHYECVINNALDAMNLLQERRTALISAAVTGKIDVRDWVAPATQQSTESTETSL